VAVTVTVVPEDRLEAAPELRLLLLQLAPL
jgi:hypothetical protein